MRQLLIIAVLLAALCGCAQNPYVKYYQPVQLQYAGSFEPTAPGEARIFQGSNVEEDRIRAIEEGYALVGYSSFYWTNVDPNTALTQANAVGAALVMVYSKYRDSRSGVMPLYTPSTATSSTNTSGMVGPYPISTTGTTTTYGGTTSYVPYSIDRFDYVATYWKKVPPQAFGVFIKEPSADEHRALGTNSGLIVYAVRKGSPAFNADIFRGDVLMRIGDVQVRQYSDFASAVRSNQGRSASVDLLRDGKPLRKQVDIGYIK